MPCVFSSGQGRFSADCGYYCAYVLKKYREQNSGSFIFFNREEVISRRDTFNQEEGRSPGGYFASVSELVRFINHPLIGLSGYHAIVYRNTVRQPRSQDGFVQAVNNMIRTPGHGIILLLQQPGSSAGHYVAILECLDDRWCVYDPMFPDRSGAIAIETVAALFWNVTTHFIYRN